MGGKSTFARAAALACVLAHVGSYVPAESAEVPLLDRVFARVGSADDPRAGQSTFVREMRERLLPECGHARIRRFLGQQVVDDLFDILQRLSDALGLLPHARRKCIHAAVQRCVSSLYRVLGRSRICRATLSTYLPTLLVV